MNMTKASSIAAALALAMVTAAGAELPVKRVLTLEVAQHIAAAAKAEADKRGSTVVIAVVDDGGQLILLERLDNTQVASVDVGIGKARTAAIFRRPSKEFEDQIRDGRVAAIALPGDTPLQGGLPILIEDEVVGAIGVSGNTPQEDEDIAKAGLAAFAESQDALSAPVSDFPVSYFPGARVTKAFIAGEPLIEQANYKVHASHRDAPGVVEVHTRDTDTIYVLDGEATFVTGGTLLDGEEIAPEEIRGSNLRGGESREITKGDVIVVPNGVPHLFKEVTNPFNYYVVKVRSAR